MFADCRDFAFVGKKLLRIHFSLTLFGDKQQNED